MKVFIVDDARLARRELRVLLQSHPEVAIAGEAGGVGEALEALPAADPEVLLLDIHMPDGSGFDLLERLDHTPAVIFTTAYDQHALRAFEANALDYLVKPIDPKRLSEALEKAGTALASSTAVTGGGKLTGDSVVFVRDGERCWFVKLAEISHIHVDGNYTHVHFRGQRALLARALSALEARLDARLFFRANRNTLVNVGFVERVDPWVNDGYRLLLRDGAEVEVSRRRARQLRETLAL